MSEDEPLSETERALRKQGIEYHRDADGTLVVPGNAFSHIFGDDEDEEDGPVTRPSPHQAELLPVSLGPSPVAKRAPITAAFNNAELIRTMAEGDRTAAAIVTAVLSDPFLGGHLTLLSFDEMNIRGRQISAAFAYCGNSLPSLLGCIATRDQGLVRHLNEIFPEEKAVIDGASSARPIGFKFSL